MWRDEIRLGGVWRCFLSAPIPLIFLSHTPLPAPPWPVLWATCGTVAYCFLWQAKLSTDHFIFDVGRQNSRRGGQSAHTHEHTLSSREHHPRRRRVSKWPNTGCLMSVCFASSLFSLSFLQKSIIVSLFIFHFHSFYPCFVLIFVFLSLLAVPFFFLWEVFLSFFLLLLSVFLFPSCFTVFYCFCLGFNFLFTLSVQSVCLSLSL